MQDKINVKKVRAIIVTIILIVATNFAISRAESVSLIKRSPIEKQRVTFTQRTFLIRIGEKLPKSLANDPTYPQPAPRPSVFFANDPTYPQPAPRPSVSFANDPTYPQPAPRPS
ncbi:MAG TPA: hypothetical protein VMM58_09240 [Bacteroidota bacterium]|nr:hypothetical protein [Bacteroidota bacterium]